MTLKSLEISSKISSTLDGAFSSGTVRLSRDVGEKNGAAAVC
jgi:hypothetical protein